MAPRPSSSHSQSSIIGSRTLVIDPGAYTIKAGFAPSDPSTLPDAQACHVIPNCIARSRDRKTYIGSQLSQCTDFGEMGFRRPVEKGYIVNWEAERAIWEHEFFSANAPLKCDPRSTNLILSEPSNSPVALQTNTDQIIFEEFGFASYYRTISPVLASCNPYHTLFSDPAPSSQANTSQVLPTELLLLIDSSYSHTTITPLIQGRPIQPAIRRLPLGGKHLSNYLAELISLRHFSLIEEPYLVNQIKEDVSFICPDSSTFSSSLEACWRGPKSARRRPDPSIALDYVLPDYEHTTRGFTRPHDASHAARMARLGVSQSLAPGAHAEEVFPLANERFTVPETLFTPSLLSAPYAGLPGTVFQSLAALPTSLHAAFLANVVCVGGNALIPGFVTRLENEIRSMADAGTEVRVRRAEDPVRSTWMGGARLGSDGEVRRKLSVTKEEYMEYGSGWVARQFRERRVGGL